MGNCLRFRVDKNQTTSTTGHSSLGTSNNSKNSKFSSSTSNSTSACNSRVSASTSGIVLSSSTSNNSKNSKFSSSTSNSTSTCNSRVSASTSGSLDEAFPNGKILPNPNLKILSFADLKSATRNFRSDTVVGEGSFGKVFKGYLDEKTLAPSKMGHGMVVAIKKLNQESSQGFEEWQSEVNFLGRLSHPNLIKLLGFCWEDKELLLVYEFMHKGSLEHHLFKNLKNALPWDIRMKIMVGAARGLAFLHTSEKQVIHRDFKPSNILLDGNYNAKISDFGLAKMVPSASEPHLSTRIMGTYGYAAPEYVATGHLYVKSDVYGFGVLLLEMLTGQRTIDRNRPSRQQNLVDWTKPFLSDRRRFKNIIDPRFDGQYPTKAAFQAAQLSLRCLGSKPKSRPSMREVVDTLEHIITVKEKPKESRTNSKHR